MLEFLTQTQAFQSKEMSFDSALDAHLWMCYCILGRSNVVYFGRFGMGLS